MATEDFTAREQLMLELVNRARLDPLGEAARFDIDLNDGLVPGRLDGTVKQPLAGNLTLVASSAAHSEWMLATNTFSHEGVDGTSSKQRMEIAGYSFDRPWASGENISWTGTTGTLNETAAIISQHENLFLSSGHRVNILNDGFKELGIGQEIGAFTSGRGTYNASMVTQNFAASGGDVFLTGVAYTDSNENRFYDIGEALPAVGFAWGANTAESAAAGGYAMSGVSSAVEEIRVSHSGSATEVSVDFSQGNVKLDYVAGDTPVLMTSANTTLAEAVDAQSVQSLEALGARGVRLTGNSESNTLQGGDGADTLVGGDGDDFIFGGHGAGDLRDIVYAGAGNDSVHGGHGNDELRGDIGDDTMEGGFGVDLLIGGAGNDVLTGSAWSDQLFGGDGDDFLNGGFGFDRLNGGSGSDRFFHLGVRDHGSDWIQDYSAAEGDLLVYGNGAGLATADDFLIQQANTTNAGNAAIDEIFVTHIPTGNILWALIDGTAESEINIVLSGEVFDLLA